MTQCRHVAVIMDGNGRWAKNKGMERSEGHKAGAHTVERVLETCVEEGVSYLTLYAFSTENWKRSKTEIRLLMTLLQTFLKKNIDHLVKNNIVFNTIGDVTKFPENIQAILKQAIDKTSQNNGLRLIVALNYGGQDEIVRACQRVLASGAEITMDSIPQHLDTADYPDPDLVIRTSGEQRLSNFLLWQCAYSEFYFTETLWPDFTKEDMKKALESLANRERRFGGVKEK